jgi:hypothetical protein
MPKHPWRVLHESSTGEFYWWLLTGTQKSRSTIASVVIPKLDKIFAVQGIPEILKSDNVPLFNGDE